MLCIYSTGTNKNSLHSSNLHYLRYISVYIYLHMAKFKIICNLMIITHNMLKLQLMYVMYLFYKHRKCYKYPDLEM